MTERRKLRSEGACQPLQNIFKSEHYRQILPPVVYAKITKTPTVNCDRIENLKFQPTPDHNQNLRLMRLAQTEPTEMKSMSNGDVKYKYREEESQSEQMKKWKRINNNYIGVQNQHYVYGEQLLNQNFLKEIDQFIME